MVSELSLRRYGRSLANSRSFTRRFWIRSEEERGVVLREEVVGGGVMNSMTPSDLETVEIPRLQLRLQNAIFFGNIN